MYDGTDYHNVGIKPDVFIENTIQDHLNGIDRVFAKGLEIYAKTQLYYKTVKISQDDYEASLRNATKSLVKSALENEKILLSTIKETVAESHLVESNDNKL